MHSYELVKSNWLSPVSSPATITDNQSSQPCAVIVNGFSKALLISHASNQPPTDWLVQRKCADGALVVQGGRRVTAHVFEHKSRLTPGEWFKAKQQLQGMCLNVRAILAVVGHQAPDTYVLHVSFTEEAMGSGPEPADIVLKKALVGSGKPLLDISDWTAGEATIEGVGTARVLKIRRDTATNLGRCEI